MSKMFDIIKNRNLADKARKKGFEDAFVIDEDIAIITESDIKELRKKILNERKTGRIIAVLGNNDEINRFVLKLNIDFILSPEYIRKRDFPDYRNSGLNQVLCAEAARSNIAIAFNFSDILHLSGEEKAIRLGRMMQNARLCRKFNVPMILATFASSEDELRIPEELISFGLSLGMSRIDAEKALNQIRKINDKKKQ